MLVISIYMECRGKYATYNFERLQSYRKQYNLNNKEVRNKKEKLKRDMAREFANLYKTNHVQIVAIHGLL